MATNKYFEGLTPEEIKFCKKMGYPSRKLYEQRRARFVEGYEPRFQDDDYDDSNYEGLTPEQIEFCKELGLPDKKSFEPYREFLM